MSALHEVRIPKLGVSTTECQIKVWHVQVGDRVAAGTALLEVETEKTDVVIEAEVPGIVKAISASVGQTVAVGIVVALIDGS